MRLRIAPLTAASLLLLACLNTWLLAALLADHALEEQMPLAKPEWVPNLPASEANPPKPSPIGAYSQTLARPVFFKSRAPYVPPPPAPPAVPKPVAVPPPAPVDPGLVLGGVIITDRARKAYLFSKAEQRGNWLSEGDTIMGWKLEAIDAMSARLRQAGRTIELQLYPKR